MKWLLRLAYLPSFIAIAWVAWWLVGPVKAAYVVDNPQAHWVRVDPVTNLLTVHRQFSITKDVEIEIVRELIRVDRSTLTRISLPTTSVFYSRGRYSIEREHEIPVLTPGRFALHNYACWQANPIRRACVTLPVLEFVTK